MNPWLLADEILLERMDDPTRARVLMLMLGLVILGGTLILFVAIGARWVRKQAQRKAASNRPPIEDKWYARPLVEPLPRNEPEDRDEQ